MSTSTRRTAAVLATLIALAVLPAVASARPIDGGPGSQAADPSTPAETVVRTVVKEQSFTVLPTALAGAALIIAIAGSGYAIVRTAPIRQQLRGLH